MMQQEQQFSFCIPCETSSIGSMDSVASEFDVESVATQESDVGMVFTSGSSFPSSSPMARALGRIETDDEEEEDNVLRKKPRQQRRRRNRRQQQQQRTSLPPQAPPASSTPQICRFYLSKRGCRHGNKCPFLHLEAPTPRA